MDNPGYITSLSMEPNVFDRGGPPDDMSRACVFGGTTKVVDFANWRPGIDLPKAIEEKDGTFNGHSYIDYTFHCILVGLGTEGATPERGVPLPLAIIDQVEELIQGGYTSIKVYTSNVTRTRARQMVDLGEVWAIAERVAAAGGVLAVHAEDEDIVMQREPETPLEEANGDGVSSPGPHQHFRGPLLSAGDPGGGVDGRSQVTSHRVV